jgi:hypothetical protein
LLLALAAVLCPAAAAHGDGGALGFTSSVTGVTPAVPGVTVRVLDRDDRLELRNPTGKEIVVLGYDGEPYLRFDGGDVFRNARSPATYLNEERFGGVKLPADADSKAPPRWERVSRQGRYDWHDHRIHWMSPILPPKVRAAEDEPHHVFDWKVPLRVDGQAVTVAGSLGYAPPPDEFEPLLLLPLVALILGGGGFWWWRRRRAPA